ncbi:MAG: hypothetical protein ACYDGN_12255 [Acidimicrobiales bacterium]
MTVLEAEGRIDAQLEAMIEAEPKDVAEFELGDLLGDESCATLNMWFIRFENC